MHPKHRSNRQTCRMSYLAKGCMIIAGALLLFETLLGCVYVLGIGFSSWRDIVTDICVTMAFPIFLIAIASLSKGAVALWAFFIINGLIPDSKARTLASSLLTRSAGRMASFRSCPP